MHTRAQAHVAPLEAAKPLYLPLGITCTNQGHRFWFDIQGVISSYRGPEMVSIGALLSLYPDADHWRTQFPLRKGRSIDTTAAAAALMRECFAKGAYTPKSE